MLGHARSGRCSIILAARLRRARRDQSLYSSRRRARTCSGRAFGCHFLVLGEPDYPVRLHAIDDPPPLIALRGNRAALALPAVGIVGSRNASAAGAKFAQMLARDWPTPASRWSPAWPAESTPWPIGPPSRLERSWCWPGGHDRIYPPERTELAHVLLANGCAISEMPLGWEPRAHDFPRCNRLISGLALGVVAVEAAKRSGSLITHGLRSSKGARSLPCRAPRSTRAPNVPTACSDRERPRHRGRRRCQRLGSRSWAPSGAGISTAGTLRPRRSRRQRGSRSARHGAARAGARYDRRPHSTVRCWRHGCPHDFA